MVFASQPPAPSGSHSTRQPPTNAEKSATNTQAKHSQASPPASTDSTTLSKPQTNGHKDEGPDYLSSEWWLVYVTAGLLIVTSGLAIYTARLWNTTKDLAEAADKTSARQASEMKTSIGEAKRSADAVEGIVVATTNTTTTMQAMMRKQMRAYLSVETGQVVLQEANIRFECKPTVTNNGFTPAKNVCTRIGAEFFKGDLPKDFNFDKTDGMIETIADLGIAPRQQPIVLSGLVRRRLSEEEIRSVFSDVEMRLYAWGSVEYDDVFGDHWKTNFCHHYIFIMSDEEKPIWLAYYSNHHNDAN
jgi:hypothetical protein